MMPRVETIGMIVVASRVLVLLVVDIMRGRSPRLLRWTLFVACVPAVDRHLPRRDNPSPRSEDFTRAELVL